MEHIRNILRGGLAETLEAACAEDRLAAAWPVVCGKAAARHTRIIGLSGTTLRVAVSDETWLDQMRSLRLRLMHDLASVADAPLTDIYFSIGNPR